MNVESVLKFSSQVRESISTWIEDMSAGLGPGRYRFCDKGNLVPTRGQSGLFVSCYAIKTAYHTGLWHDMSDEVKDSSVQFIRSFQKPDGWFLDNLMVLRTKLGMFPFLLAKGRFNEWLTDVGLREIRALTRSAASTLFMVKSRPNHNLPILARTSTEVRNYIQSLDWTNPWGAGSHASHLIFITYINGRYFQALENYRELIKIAFDECETFRDMETGIWGLGNVSPTVGVNGAMKILTACKWTRYKPTQIDVLLDYALDQPFEHDGCGFLDRLFVVRETSLHLPGYREAEIQKLAIDYLKMVQKFRRSDGGFSYFENRAQKWHNGALISLGGMQSDMHGAVMLTWAIALALEILGVGEISGWHSSTP